MAVKVPPKKIADCRELYIEHGGLGHDLIVEGMHARGWRSFTKRNLYARTRNGRIEPGWPELFGWPQMQKPARQQGRYTQPGPERIVRGRRGEGETQRRRDSDPRVSASRHPRVNSARRTYAREHTPLRPAAFEATDNPRSNRQKARRLRRQRERCAHAGSQPHNVGPKVPASPRLSLSASSSPPTFHAWLKTLPGIWGWDYRHQLYLYERLQRVTDGGCTRLMIFMPPRHGKSELVTVRYTAWRLKQTPSLNVILASYAQDLANKFSRKIRRVLTDDAAGEDAGMRNDAETRGHVDAGTQPNVEAVISANGDCCRGPGHQVPASPRLSLPASSSTPRLSDSAVKPNSDAPLFPFLNARPINRVAEWETSEGGGLRAVGVGAGVTGYGANLIVIDDPVKSREQANSQRFRDKLWDWYNDDLATRLEPKGSIILIQTRWHEDDLAGRLLREMENGGEHWDVVNLPALAERSADTPVRTDAASAFGHNADSKNADVQSAGFSPYPTPDPAPDSDANADAQEHDKSCTLNEDPLGRATGEPLWPERFDADELEAIRTRQGEFAFASLYQQRPVPAEGGVFKREWFTNIVTRAPQGLKWKRGWDLAVSLKESADYTASFRVAYDADGNLYIDGGYRGRIGFPEQKRRIEQRILAESDTEHGIELAVHGAGVMQELRQMSRIRGRRFIGVTVRGGKHERALKWQDLASEGRIRLVRGPWNRTFIEEACAFPHGHHDDQIDAVSLAVSMFERKPSKLYVF